MVDTDIWLLAARRARRHRACARLIAETGWLPLEGGPAARARVHEPTERYADLPLDLVDASPVAVAERLGHTTIATLDHRDIRVVRPSHCDAFEPVP